MQVFLTGHTEVDEAGVADYLGARVLALLCELGITELSVLLVPKQGETVTFSTSSHTRLMENDVQRLIGCMHAIGSTRFVFDKDSYSYVGYSENDLDWVVVGLEDEYRNICEELIGPLWYQFYEH